jgi:hypothetical protein
MHRLISARTEAEIVAIVRDYLVDWHPRELAELPPACRPGKIRDGEDLNDLAFALTQCRIANRTEQFDRRRLGELEAFMAKACSRLAEIEAKPISHGPNCDPESTPPAQA